MKELEIIDTGCNPDLIMKLNGQLIDLTNVDEYRIIRNTRDIILELKGNDLKVEKFLIDKVKSSIDFTKEDYRFISKNKDK